MRKLFAIAILAALAYGGYWFFLAHMRRDLLEDWLADRRADGWIAETTALKVEGFPSRIDTFVDGLSLADPEEGWRWDADAFQILSLAWKPNHLVAAWPGKQVVGTPYESLAISGDVLRGSVVFKPTPRLELDRTTIELGDVTFTGDLGWQAGISKAIFAVRNDPDVARNAYRIGLDASGLIPPNAWMEELPGSDALPRRMETVSVDAHVIFDRPWDRISIEEENPAIRSIALADARVHWGALDLRAEGELVADADGYADGEVTLRARNWREMLAIAESSGAMTAAMAGTLRSGLDLIAMLSGDEDNVQVPVTFADGRARVGPVPIGRAPLLSRSANAGTR
jgi:hypothetical protein